MNLNFLNTLVWDKAFYLSIEIYLISIFMLLFAYYLVNTKLGKTEENRHFKEFFFATIISVVTDLFCFLFDTISSSDLRILNMISNVIYISISMILSYEWFIFAISKMNLPMTNNKTFKYVSKGIVILHIAICIASLKTGWMFSVDESGVYQRGNLFFLQLVPWALPISISILSLYKYFDKKDISNKKIYASMIIYTLFPGICEIFQIIGAGSPSLSLGYTLGAVCMYVLLMEDSISSDQLTGLDNRNYLYKYLNQKLKKLSPTNDTYLFMLDINDFKMINDTYGHIEGDKALKIVAQQLKDFGKEKGCYAARYGGDEFVLIADNINKIDCKQLIVYLNAKLKDACKTNNLQYNLSFSAGFAKCKERYLNDISKLIDKADSYLYINKSVYKESKNKLEKAK